MKIDFVVGARPNMVKAAPLYHELRARAPQWTLRLIQTVRPHDEKLSRRLLEQLELPEPDVDLGIGPDSYLQQTAGMMLGLEQVFEISRPDAVVVFGDANCTIAGALSASQLGIPVAHVEAGLRSFDRATIEEMNRVLTDAVSDWLFTTEREADANLRREGIADHKIHFAGNTLIDSLAKHRPAAAGLQVAGRMGLAPRGYVLTTLHQADNVSTESRLRAILYALLSLADDADVVFPMHPRTMERVRTLGLWQELQGHRRLRLMGTLGYLEFIGLLNEAGAVLTDSGSVQEEALVMGVPCVTLRRHTERPVTVQCGGNRLAGDDPHLAIRYVQEALGNGPVFNALPEGWDGKAAERIAGVLVGELAKKVGVGTI